MVGLRSGPWTDVHALMLVELLAGRPAYDPGQERFAIISPTRPTPKTLGLDVGPWEAVLADALALQPSDRIPHAAALLSALDRGLEAADAALGAPPEPTPPDPAGQPGAPEPARLVETPTGAVATTVPDRPTARSTRALPWLSAMVGALAVLALAAGAALVVWPRLARSTTTKAAAPSLDPDDGEEVGCEQTARTLPGAEGTSRIVHCGPCERVMGNLWGTDIYTDDSPICAAATHAGALSPRGGRVLVTFVPSVAAYMGTTRNELTSLTWDKGWGRSFYVQQVDASGKPTSPAPLGLDPRAPLVTCTEAPDALALRGLSRAVCPAGCKAARVYGSGPYTSDSSLCSAARHAGVLRDGGPVGFALGPIAKGFKSSMKNGVITTDWSLEHRTFTPTR